MELNEKQHRYQARKALEAQTVPKIPPPVDPDRREACRNDLHLFLRTYFPHSTGLSPFSEDHILAIKRMENSILKGGGIVLTCFPRGFGKTTISENLAIWAAVYGHKRLIPIIGADKPAASDTIDSLKSELTVNELLADDFPEVVMPFIHIDNKSQRANTQKYNDELTHVRWSGDELGFAWIKGDDGEYRDNSGVLFRCLGITGRIRGMSVKLPNGKKQRPDFFILDDPQTDESARSPAQVEKRMSIYQKSILRLGGHDKMLSGVINATVIEPEDMVDILLSDKHPEVEGLRIPMLKELSDVHETMWLEDYADLRKTYNPEDPDGRRLAIQRANEFYLENRIQMDSGALPTWEHCFAAADGEVSAVQHAYNILIDDGPEVFASECQNDPIASRPSGIEILTPSAIKSTRIMGSAMLPRDTEVVTAHIDVQKNALYYCVTGFSKGFSVYPFHYGVYPDQRSGRMFYSDLRQTLRKKYVGLSDEERITHAVRDLLRILHSRTYERQDGFQMKLEMCLVDAGYQTDAVFDGITSFGGSNVYRMYGRGVRSTEVPMLMNARKKGERRSKDLFVPWRQLIDINKRSSRYVLACVNSVKTFLHRRIRTEPGQDGQFRLPEGNHDYLLHSLCSSEYPTETEGPYGRIVEWSVQPGVPDNHLLDCVCGSIVAASMTGQVAFGQPPARVSKPQKKNKVVYL